MITGDPLHSGTVTYGLDKVGNREARTSSVLSVPSVVNPLFNPRDQLLTHTYDANGNTTQASDPLVTGHSSLVTDSYDFEDRLIIRHRADGSTINLSYNSDGLRTQKTILNASGQFVSSTSYLVCTNNLTGYAQVLEETTTDATGTTSKTYIYGQDLLSVSESSTSTSTFNTRYYAYDGGGSVRALTDESGAITDRYTYDAFGVLLEHTGTSDNVYLYRGEQWDVDLGLYYLRARFMNPDSGRFWNQDTYEGRNSDPTSLHKYLYAHGNPVSFSDPTGHMSLGELMTGVTVNAILARMAIAGGFALVDGLLSGQRGWDLAQSVGLSAAIGAIGGPALGQAQMYAWGRLAVQTVATVGAAAAGYWAYDAYQQPGNISLKAWRTVTAMLSLVALRASWKVGAPVPEPTSQPYQVVGRNLPGNLRPDSAYTAVVDKNGNIRLYSMAETGNEGHAGLVRRGLATPGETLGFNLVVDESGKVTVLRTSELNAHVSENGMLPADVFTSIKKLFGG